MIAAAVGGMPLNDGGWKILDTEGLLDSPGFEVPSVERLRHGALSGLGRATGRTIKIIGRVETRDQVQQMTARNQLMSLFRGGAQVPLSVDMGGLQLGTDVQLIDRVTFEPSSVYYARWELSLYSADSFLCAPARISYSFPVGIGVGLGFDLFSTGGVLTYGSAVDADQDVQNHGTETSYPSMYVYGDLPGGFSIRAAGKTILWPWPVDEGRPVRIEHTGSVWVGDSNLTHMARVRQWMPLQPGDIYRPTLTALQGGTGYLETHQRDPYV